MKRRNILLVFGGILILLGGILTIIREKSFFYHPLAFLTMGLAVVAIVYIIKMMTKHKK